MRVVAGKVEKPLAWRYIVELKPVRLPNGANVGDEKKRKETKDL